MRKIILPILFFTTMVNYINAQSWSSLGTGIGSAYYHSVHSFATYNGELYIAGYFTSAGNLPVNNIAKWNGVNWSIVGAGISGDVRSLCAFNGELYAGGYFSTAGGISAIGIAKWNGTTWANVGNAEASVQAMAVYNGELYAAGWFSNLNSGGSSIAKWNGNSWTAVVPENDLYSVSIECMAVYNGNLYAAGAYYQIGGGGVAEFYRITSWNGTGWSDLLTIPASYTLDGALGDILSMKVYNGELYIAGNFTSVDTITTSQIAKWNGSNWSAVGTGINFGSSSYGIDGSLYTFVKSLEVYNGGLFAAGWFSHCGTTPTLNIAKWNGTSWSALGQGVNWHAYALIAFDTSLYVGGWFNAVNGNNIPANNVARWNIACSIAPEQPLNINGNVTVCANSSATYTVNAAPGATSYTWSLPPGWTGNSTTDTITITAGTNGGVISVTANNDCGVSNAQSLTITLGQVVPDNSGMINGDSVVCENTLHTYSIAPVQGATNYIWDLPPGWSGYSNTNSITITAGENSGIVSVVADNSCGASAPQTIMITSNSIPVMPAFINGNDTVCEGSSQTYFINPIPEATGYAWDLTFGTAFGFDSPTITITALHSGYPDDFITVSAYNNCGNSDMLTLPVKVNLIPPQPGSITGNLSVCKGSAQTYSINPVYGAASYTWMLPPGWVGNSTTSSITVTAGNEIGSISVNANNSCGSSGSYTSVPIQIDTIPPTPGDITGNIYVWVGQSHSYFVSPINNITAYSWSLNDGGNIIKGQNTSKIDILWQTPGTYLLSVNTFNTCGVSAKRTLTVKVSPPDDKDPFSLQLFPNPSSGEIYLKAKRVQDKILNVEVLNMAGQLVFRSGKRQGTNDYSQLINLDKIAKGLYAVKIMIDDKTYGRSVMIKH